MNPDFSKALFWDIDIKELDYEKHARYIIERVLTRGNWSDWQKLKAHYGLKKISDEAMKIRYLDNKTFNFIHTLFNIPKEKFRCYNTEPSIRKLWAY